MLKKCISIILISLFFCLKSNLVLAQELESCFKYYDYAKVYVNLTSEKTNYLPQEKIHLQGNIVNDNKIPLVDIVLYAQIKRVNYDLNSFNAQGHYLVDRLVLKENLNFLPNDSKKIDVEITLPWTYPQGDYKIYYHIFSKNEFHYGGRPFLEEDAAGTSAFFLKNNTSPIYFNINQLKINGQNQNIRSQIKEFNKEALLFSLPIVDQRQNKSSLPVNVKIYSFEDTFEENLVKENIDKYIPGKNFEYSFLPEKSGAYVILFEINNPIKTIFKYRFAITGTDINELRINDLGVSNYPVNKNSDRAFICFHSPTNNNTPLTQVQLQLLDQNKRLIDSKIINNVFGPTITATSLSLTKLVNTDDFYISAKIIRDNQTKKEIEVHYNKNNFSQSVKTLKLTFETSPRPVINIAVFNTSGQEIAEDGYLESIKIYDSNRKIVQDAYNLQPIPKIFQLKKLTAGSYTAEARKNLLFGSVNFNITASQAELLVNNNSQGNKLLSSLNSLGSTIKSVINTTNKNTNIKSNNQVNKKNQNNNQFNKINNQDTDTGINSSSQKNNFMVIITILIILMFILVGVGVYLFYKQKKPPLYLIFILFFYFLLTALPVSAQNRNGIWIFRNQKMPDTRGSSADTKYLCYYFSLNDQIDAKINGKTGPYCDFNIDAYSTGEWVLTGGYYDSPPNTWIDMTWPPAISADETSVNRFGTYYPFTFATNGTGGKETQQISYFCNQPKYTLNTINLPAGLTFIKEENLAAKAFTSSDGKTEKTAPGKKYYFRVKDDTYSGSVNLTMNATYSCQMTRQIGTQHWPLFSYQKSEFGDCDYSPGNSGTYQSVAARRVELNPKIVSKTIPLNISMNTACATPTPIQPTQIITPPAAKFLSDKAESDPANPKMGQKWICLKAQPCGGKDNSLCSNIGDNNHKVKLSEKANGLLSSTTKTYIFECLQKGTDYQCTSGVPELDQDILGKSYISDLKSKMGYDFKKIISSEGIFNQAIDSPIVTNVYGQIGPFEWESFTATHAGRIFMGVQKILKSDLTVIKSMQQGSYKVIEDNAQCVLIKWDPHGVVYDSGNLDVITDATITLYEKKGNQYVSVNNSAFNGAINPIKTDKNGKFYFNVKDGIYKLEVSKTGYEFDLKKYLEKYQTEDIIQKGESVERNLPLKRIGFFTNILKRMNIIK